MAGRFAAAVVRYKSLWLVTLATALLMSVYTDVRYALAMPGDMRNRLVGSRIMKDGLSPYFYIWKQGDTMRYYDTHLPPNSFVSFSTATPFFHFILEPFADLPQYQFSIFWFAVEYLCLAACCLLALLALPPPRKMMVWAVAVFAVLFTYTIGWRTHLNAGQNYLLLPVMAMGCLYCLLQKKDTLHLLLFALFACSLVLLRPIAALYFVPLLFYFKTCGKWLCTAAVAMAAYIVFVMASPVQKLNWQEYFRSVEVHAQVHQNLLPPLKKVDYDPVPVKTFEGIDFNTEGSTERTKALNKSGENSNFYYLYYELLHRQVSIKAMTMAGIVACIILLIPLALLKKKKQLPSPVALLLLGFLVYNMFEFFTPINRPAYHWVQFIFPLLAAILYMQQRLYVIPLMLLLAGIYLNIVVWPSVKMEHNAGEALVVVALLWLVYRPLMVREAGERKLQLRNAVYIA